MPDTGHIEFNGSDLFGIVVEKAPNIIRPTRKVTRFSVPGRNGDIVMQQDAWENYEQPYDIWTGEDQNYTAQQRFTEIASILNSSTGYCRLEDDFEPEIYRMATFNGPMDAENILNQYGRVTLSFDCRPERFLKTGEIERVVNSGTTLFNPTRFKANPLIHIEGSGEVSVQIGGKTITATVNGYINIDCETMNAYKTESDLQNTQISGDFPVINPGDNVIGITGSPTLVSVVPRYFTI